MMDAVTFLVGGLVLLATPGPTNTLLATAGAVTGFRSSLPLLVAELLGYLTAISLLMVYVGPTLGSMPWLKAYLQIAVCLYLIYLALVLWRRGDPTAQGRPAITFHRVLITTFLNPKAIVFAFTLIPGGDAGDILTALPWLAALSLLIVSVGSSWIFAGASIARGIAPGLSGSLIYRSGALALLLFAAALGGQVASGRSF